MAAMPEVNRRRLLHLGAAAAAGAVGAGLAVHDFGSTPSARTAPVSMAGGGSPLPAPPPLQPPAVPAPTMVTGSFVSAARGGVPTNWAIARPPGQTTTLRPVIALHGKNADAASVMAGGVEHGLAQAVNAGLPPVAVVSVDGGGSYWHKRTSR